MKYQFQDPINNSPTDEDYTTLENLTKMYYWAVFQRAFANNVDTTLVDLSLSLLGASFIEEELITPVEVSFELEAMFTTDSAEIPSSDDIISIMELNIFDDVRYIETYLQSEDGGIWKNVQGVVFEDGTSKV